MKKWMVAAMAAIAINAQAGTIYWSFEDSMYLTLGNSGTLYIVGLGDDWHDFGDGSFDPATRTLTSATDGTPFVMTDVLEFLSVYSYSWDSSDIQFKGLDTGPEPFNQWWAVVIVGDDMPGRFGIDVFEVSGLNEDGTWIRGVYTHPGLGYVYDSSPIQISEFLHNPFAHPNYYAIIPEPATGLLVLGGAAVVLLRRRRK